MNVVERSDHISIKPRDQDFIMDATAAACAELASTGVLRVAIALSPVPSPFFAIKHPETGQPEGVTVDLAETFAAQIGLPHQLVVYPNSGEITERAEANEWDVTFMPVDAERAKKVVFGPSYALVESSYLTAPSAAIHDYTDLDRAEVRVVAVANTATARSAARALQHAKLVQVATVDDAVEALRTNEADALALSRGALGRLAAGLPGARVLDGHFHATSVAVAVPPGRPLALGLVTEWIEQAKETGQVRRALDEAGLEAIVVAPPAGA